MQSENQLSNTGVGDEFQDVDVRDESGIFRELWGFALDSTRGLQEEELGNIKRCTIEHSGAPNHAQVVPVIVVGGMNFPPPENTTQTHFQ